MRFFSGCNTILIARSNLLITCVRQMTVINSFPFVKSYQSFSKVMTRYFGIAIGIEFFIRLFQLAPGYSARATKATH